MRIVAVDDDEMCRSVLESAICEAAPEAELYIGADAEEILSHEDTDTYDVAFLDIGLPGMDGLDLARQLKLANPRVNVIFVTAHSEYMLDAFEMHSSGYLLKPINTHDIAHELQNLRFTPAPPTTMHKLHVRCFGEFRAYGNGGPLTFGRSKTQELFAYLVHRKGEVVTLREAMSVLWTDSAYGKSGSSYLRTLIWDLRKTLRSIDCEDVLVRSYGKLSVDTKAFSCDYYDFLTGKSIALNAWHGEYMRQYEWAQQTAEELKRLS